MPFRDRSIDELAEMVCGNTDTTKGFFRYRSRSYLTRFFRECDTDYEHDGTTRAYWVADCLRAILCEPQPQPHALPTTFCTVIRVLMDPADATDTDTPDRASALAHLNRTLNREGYDAFYAEDQQCYLRHIRTNTVGTASPNPHRPLSAAEIQRRERLLAYLEKASEDELIEEVLLPLFRQLGFHRITPAGHKDKALEYGKDIWMKHTLPTMHVLYFGIQAKRGKIDAAGATRDSNSNVAEIYNQLLMMIGHEIFDPEISKRVLVDHAFIVAGGEITKQAKNWLGNKLDATKRNQIMFMDREDILNLYVVSPLPLPKGAEENDAINDDIPF